jgi:4-hydroxy-tetrahydrodipicolinate synthase
MRRHFATIAASTSLPIMVYDGASKLTLSVDQLAQLRADHPSIAYVKLSTPNPEKVSDVLKGAPGVIPLCGDDYMLLTAMRLGAMGSTIGIGNVLPSHVRSFHAAFARGDLERARTVHLDSIVPAVSICGTSKFEYIRCFKEVLAHQGIIASPTTREPLVPLNPIRREELLATMAHIGKTAKADA